MTCIIFKAYKIFFIYIFFYLKMPNNYYEKHKEKIRKEARERYQNFSEEEKETKHQYHRKRNKNPSEEQRQKQ